MSKMISPSSELYPVEIEHFLKTGLSQEMKIKTVSVKPQ